MLRFRRVGRNMRSRACIAVSIVLYTMAAVACGQSYTSNTPPEKIVYLTWQRDPTTTMTIHWLSDPADTTNAVRFGARDAELAGAVDGTSRALPHTSMLVHTVELTDLEPGEDYSFQIDGRDERHGFRTMPADTSEPITFVAGGDVYGAYFAGTICRQVAKRDPAFVVLGGDIAYCNGEAQYVTRWYGFLGAWQDLVRGADGRLIPIVAAIGNHEVNGRFDQTPDKATFFHALFAFPGPPSYNALDFGDYLSFICLDSGHTNPIGGVQTQWLDSTLAARRDVPLVMAVYHVPAYPSVRSLDGRYSAAIRGHWTTLFDKYGLEAAFENHDHAYKRTPRITDGKPDPEGVLYLGDGGWGAEIRATHDPEATWYLDRAESRAHFIEVTLHHDRASYRAIDDEGVVFDECPE